MKVPSANMEKLFPRSSWIYWEPSACPYADGNSSLDSFVFDETRVSAYWRKDCDRDSWNDYMESWRKKSSRAIRAQSIMDGLDRKFRKELSQDKFRFGPADNYLQSPVTDRDEWGYVKKPVRLTYHYIVAAKGSSFKLCKPVFCAKFVDIEEEKSPRGGYMINPGRYIRLHFESAFDTLFDVLFVDPNRRIALHWSRREDGRFAELEPSVHHPGDLLHLKGLGLSLAIPNF